MAGGLACDGSLDLRPGLRGCLHQPSTLPFNGCEQHCCIITFAQSSFQGANGKHNLDHNRLRSCSSLAGLWQLA